jgi:hypothetical protein
VLVALSAPAAVDASTRGVYDVFGEAGSESTNVVPGGAFLTGNGKIGTVAVNSSGAGGANPGDVYVADRADNRIQRFDKDGNFLSAWGIDVDKTGGTGFEVCVVATSCKPGLAKGSGGGLSNPNAVAVDQQNGDVYVADQSNVRVDEFTATGTFIRAWGLNVVASGSEQADEAQRLTVDAGGGQYRLSFWATDGTGLLTNGSTEVKSTTTSAGTFAVGQPIAGPGIPAGTTITAVEAEPAPKTTQKLTLSANATETTFGSSLSAGPVSTTADIEWNEPAAGLAAKLNALPTIGAAGGSVAVSGGIGAPGGAGPYRIEFAGALANANLSALVVSSGTTPLSGGAASATIATLNEGAEGFEVCETAANCQAGSSGAGGGAFDSQGLEGIAVAPAGAPNAGNVLVADSFNNRVEEFTPGGSFLRAFGWNVAASGPGNITSGANEVRSLSVAATAGTYRLEVGFAATSPIPYNAPASTIEAELNALSSVGGAGGSVNVSGGPGDQTGSAPYTIVFGGALAHEPIEGILPPVIGSTLSGGTPASAATVVTTTSGGAFEVCNAAGLDICQKGTESSVKSLDRGPFLSGPARLAEDSSGDIYTVEKAPDSRVQRFTLAGNTVTPDGALDPGELSATSARDLPLAVAVDTSAAPGTTARLFVLKNFPTGTGTPPAPVEEARVLEVDPAAAGGSGKVLATLAARGRIGAGHSFARGLALNTVSGRLYTTAPVETLKELAFVSILDAVPGIGSSGVEAIEVGSSTATLRAMITPAALPHLHTLYRFEYAKAGTAGNCGEGAAGWTKAPVLEGDVGNGGPVEVQAPLSNLDFEATYEFCLLARTQFNGAEAFVPGTFTTHPTPPLVHTGGAIWSSPPATAPSLLLGGTVNPGHARTTYRFEYVSQSTYQADLGAGGEGFEHAAAVPVPAAEAGRGAETVAVHQSIAGLDPGTTYAYRLVATNEAGSGQGAVRTVEPPSASGRFYELVSAGTSWGSGTSKIVGDIAGNGDRATFEAQAFGQPGSLPGPANTFLSSRGPGGWTVRFVGPEAASSKVSSQSQPFRLFADDLGTALWPESSFSGLERGEVLFSLVGADGSRSTAFGPLAPLSRSGKFQEYEITGATPSLATFVFRALMLGSPPGGAVTYLPGEAPVTTSNLYQVSGAGTGSSTLTIVNRGGAASGSNPLGVIGGRCGAGLGGAMSGASGVPINAISADGSSVYFSARPGEPLEGSCTSTAPRRIFRRVNSETTVEVSASECTPVPACPGSPTGDDTYQGASASGQVAFFTTNRRLVNSDTDSTNDLYIYDAGLPAGQQLSQASAGETVGAHVAGSGAKVLGVLDTAADGSRVYFVAEGVLTGENAEHAAPLSGRPNLYVYDRESGEIAFLGMLDGNERQDSNSNPIGDGRLWGLTGSAGGKEAYALPTAGSGDGRFLLFGSFAKLTSEDGDEARDIYRYDSATEEMQCLSCQGDGPFNAAISPRFLLRLRPDKARSAPPASADASTVVFATAEALLPEDENEGKNLNCTANAKDVQGCDVYAWRDGRLSLITGGTEGFGAGATIVMSGISADGRNIFFTTQAQLVAADTNNALDLYDARVGGGFPAAGTQAACTGSEECQGPVQVGPAAGQPGSATFAGPGNPAVAPPKPCRKGFVRRGGKCMRRPRHPTRHQRKHQRANRKSGGRS